MKKPGLDLELHGYFAPTTMTLATTGADGAPHAAPVYFAAVQERTAETALGWRLYFFSEPDSQHSTDLARRATAAGAIYPECRHWQEIHGVQLRGTVSPIPRGEQRWESAWQAYKAKFSFVSELKPIVQRNTLYAFIPSWIRVVDNRRGFGFKEEWGDGAQG